MDGMARIPNCRVKVVIALGHLVACVGRELEVQGELS